ncbi:MAG: FtsX-like permease family protein [Streptococcaceae bacterium]|jgi:putative ABC transport system permease protein|nr:FtsX-like permease family protein [Streptococcaceae bacterium]
MLSNLVLNNIKTQFKNYIVYFASMAFSVMVFYSFMAMSYNADILRKMDSDARVDAVLRVSSVIILIFIFVFMTTANAYFIKRRKKEIALYNLLGMRKGQIGKLFFAENLALGLISLLIGLFFGVIFSKLFGMILVYSMNLGVNSGFFISLKAIQITSLVFVILLFLVSMRSASTIYRYRLVSLFKSEQTGDQNQQMTVGQIILGILGFLMLGSGYYLANDIINFITKLVTDYHFGVKGFFVPFIIILVLCVGGTYILFRSGLVLFVWLSSLIKKRYYKGLNMVTTGSLRFHLRKNSTTLATIAIMCGTTIAAIAGSAAVYVFGMSDVNNNNPTSFAVDSQNHAVLVEAIQKADGRIEGDAEMNYKISKISLSFDRDKNNLTQQDKVVEYVNVLSLSNYNQARKQFQSNGTLALKTNEVVLFNQAMASFESLEVKKPAKMDGLNESLKVKKIYETGISTAAVDYGFKTLVVSDEIFNKLPTLGAYQINQLSVAGSDGNKKLNRIIKETLPKVTNYAEINDTNFGAVSSEKSSFSLEETKHSLTFQRSNLSMRYPEIQKFQARFGLLIYAAVFTGIVLLVASGSIIMMKQLGEAEDEKPRYLILRKLGVQRFDIRKSVYKQNFFVFLVPMVVALTHAFFANRVLVTITPIRNYSLAYIACGALLVIYLLFYMITSDVYNRIVNE